MTTLTANTIRTTPSLIPGDLVQKVETPTTSDIHVIQSVSYGLRNGWTVPVYKLRRDRDGRIYKRTFTRPELRVVGILTEQNGQTVTR